MKFVMLCDVMYDFLDPTKVLDRITTAFCVCCAARALITCMMWVDV